MKLESDLVKVTSTWNKLLELDTSLKVLKKKFVLWRVNKVEFSFNTTKVVKLNFIEDFNDMKNKINNL